MKYDKKTGKYFAIPNDVILASSTLRDLIPVYIQLIKRRSEYDDKAYMIMNDIIEASGRKLTKTIRAGCDAHVKIISCLEWLKSNQYINIVDTDILNIYDFGLTKRIKFKINREKIKSPQKFALLYVEDVERLLDISQQFKIRYNNLLLVYCYIAERIYSNKRKTTTNKWRPEVVSLSPSLLQDDLNISKLTLNKILTALVDGKMLDRYVFNPTKTEEDTYYRHKSIYAIHEEGVTFNSQIAAALRQVKQAINEKQTAS